MGKNYVKEMAKVFELYRFSHSVYTAFEDFLELMSIGISNTVDIAQWDKREARYMQIISKYSRDEANEFSRLHALLANALGDKPDDYLGRLFMELELYDQFKGQYFTPINLAMLLAKIHESNIEEVIREKGYVTVSDPTSGSAVTLIAFYKMLQECELNPQKVMQVVAQDIDKKAVHMAYIQLSLLGVNATIIHGDTLHEETREVWYSPGYFFRWGYGDFQRQNDNLRTLDDVQELVINNKEITQLSLF